MRSYSELEVFNEAEVKLLKRATDLVQSLPEDPHFSVRCHELSRAVYRAIVWPYPASAVRVVDGKFGGCEHSWISMIRRNIELVLDVYAVGSLPMVQLVTLNSSFGLLHTRRYIEGTERTDIDETRVQQLLLAWQHS